MIKPLRIALAVALAATLPATVLAQGASATAVTAKADGARVAAAEIQVRAKVVEIDTARRVVTLRGPKGNVVAVEVPAEVRNFDQIRIGDDLVVRHTGAVVVALEPARKNSGIRERIESSSAAAAPAGGMPGVAVGRRVEVLAQITALDRKARTATLRGARRTVMVSLPEGLDLSKVKVGDDVHAVIVEAVVINVEHVAAKK
jgi:hypothetical protein